MANKQKPKRKNYKVCAVFLNKKGKKNNAIGNASRFIVVNSQSTLQPSKKSA